MNHLDVENLGPFKSIFIYSKSNTNWENLLDGSNLQILEMKFENKSLFFKAMGHDDSIEINDNSSDELALLHKKNLSDEAFWKQCLEQSILFFWILTNSQGYTDGFQIQFGPIYHTRTIQIVVEASKFKFYSLDEQILQ